MKATQLTPWRCQGCCHGNAYLVPCAATQTDGDTGNLYRGTSATARRSSPWQRLRCMEAWTHLDTWVPLPETILWKLALRPASWSGQTIPRRLRHASAPICGSLGGIMPGERGFRAGPRGIPGGLPASQHLPSICVCPAVLGATAPTLFLSSGGSGAGGRFRQVSHQS